MERDGGGSNPSPIPFIGDLAATAYIASMADKPAPKADDSYSEKETARRRDATIRAMIGMPPAPHATASEAKRKQTPARKLRTKRTARKP
jgi:hypothetical protein